MNILNLLAIGLIIVFAAELWQALRERKSRHKREEPAPSLDSSPSDYLRPEPARCEPVPQHAPQRPISRGQAGEQPHRLAHRIKRVLRIILAPLAGFFAAAFSAGILESLLSREIALESRVALLLIVGWTLLIWRALTRRGPLKEK